MATPEAKVKAKVKELLKAYEAYWHCPVQNGMGSPALDFWVCHKGRFCGIETKAPGKRPTPRQLLTIQTVQDAGGTVFVIDGIEEFNLGDGLVVTGFEALEIWLRSAHG